jgi:hypothetical protein
MRVKQWLVLVYRIPSEPASKRVAIWRDLKRTGALYLQQCVCILPDLRINREEFERVMAKVSSVGGETVRFVVPRLDPGDEARIIEGFREQRTSEYAESLEECETKFQKEIEFEHSRHNYTFEEVEEIEEDLEKIRRWYDRIKERRSQQDTDSGVQAAGAEFDAAARGLFPAAPPHGRTLGPTKLHRSTVTAR